MIASTIYGGSGKDSVYIVNGASTAALIDGGVGNDFLSLGGLSGTSSVLGAAGADSITVAGNASGATQWLVDGGDDADSLYITNASERSSVLGGSGADSINISVVSKGLVLGGEGNDTIKVTSDGVTSASLKAGIGDDFMSITGGITDGSLRWYRKRQL